MNEMIRDTPPVLSSGETRRYGRQLVLEQIGPDGQARMKAARVLVIGSGGLGAPVLLYLAAAGIGHLGIVDFDTVDQSNLQRQVIFGEADVGRPKTAAAAERLRAQNPHVTVMAHEARLSPENAAAIIAGHDVVVDATDNFAARYVINDVCAGAGVPNVSASILRFDAQVTVLDPSRGGPCYRCLYPAPPPPGLAPSCAEAGVLGVLPGIAGTLQANEVIKLVCGIGTPLIGRLLTFDALETRFRCLDTDRDPDCPCCGVTADHHGRPGLPVQASIGAGAEEPVRETSAEALASLLAAGEAPFLLDVRGAAERAIAEIPESHGIALDDLEAEAGRLPRDRPILCICHKGLRSATAVRHLTRMGFEDVASLAGGVDAWALRIDPALARY